MRHIADDYDNYFAGHRLFDFDEQVLLRSLAAHGGCPGQWVADLGCGTGRALVRVTQAGYRGLAIDLSQAMLRIVRRKAQDADLPIRGLRANLVELDGLADASVDHACSLFSTLGMIRGRENRRQLLRHVRRIVRPGGAFVLHVHNLWFNLYDPGGVAWVAGSLARSWLSRDFELGDRVFPYRGVSQMFLHVFRRGELSRDLRRCGFARQQWIPLDPRRHQQLAWSWLAGRYRANGWIIVCS
ncbi:MAG: class I SAM-dependent methyltransferase [Pirellulaceae bacterium]|nr:class I SAM-dependent methyltransferase [Pirellulaceae bacterium]